MSGKITSFARRVRAHVRSQLVGYIAFACFAVAAASDAADGPLAGQNTVGSEDIIGNEVKSDDIGNGRIFNLDFADGSVRSGKIRDSTLLGADVAPDALGGGDIDESTLFNDNSLNGADIDESTLFNDDSLASNDIAASAAQTSEIGPLAALTGEVENDTITAADLGAGSVAAAEIATNAVRANELGPVVVERTAGTIPADDFDSLFAGCPEGYKLLGGGYAAAPGVRAMGGEILIGASIYAANFLNESNEAKAAEVIAVCLAS